MCLVRVRVCVVCGCADTIVFMLKIVRCTRPGCTGESRTRGRQVNWEAQTKGNKRIGGWEFQRPPLVRDTRTGVTFRSAGWAKKQPPTGASLLGEARVCPRKLETFYDRCDRGEMVQVLPTSSDVEPPERSEDEDRRCAARAADGFSRPSLRHRSGSHVKS